MNDGAGCQHRVAKLFLARNIRARRAFFHHRADADSAENGAGVSAHLAVLGETVERSSRNCGKNVKDLFRRTPAHYVDLDDQGSSQDAIELTTFDTASFGLHNLFLHC
jgi:hypothetical protein